MRRFHPLDWTRNVGASHIGQRSPSGRMKKKITVAAIARRMKNPTKATAKSTASDIIITPQERGSRLSALGGGAPCREHPPAYGGHPA
jgi:hypothetical protein